MSDWRSTDDACHPAVPRLPDLELVRKLGQGGYGEVWLAANTVTGRPLAVKLIALKGARAEARIRRELASLIRYEAVVRGEHPNLATIHHVGETAEYLYYTMDLADSLDGRPGSLEPSYQPATLADRIAEGPLPSHHALVLARELLGGLAAIHRAGCAHRDIKPANCLLVNGRVQLADFGLLTHTDSTVSVVGTPRYMPPDGHMDARADVYAAGLVIYELLTGLSADQCPHLPSELMASTRDPTFRLLNTVILKACDPDPDKRFENADAMRAALDQRAGRAGPWTRRRVLVGGLVAAVLLGAGALMASGLWSRSEPQTVAVNFITVPFEAEIYLDGKRADQPDGRPWRTPCTVTGLSPRPHRLMFRKAGYPDLSAGTVNFERIREVEVHWPGHESAEW